ncbi:MAG: hypothetical protein K8S16_05720 [Bacteroidales bacterium]|nr:hypothetical protein [Bacteroidales bacterium]
MYFLYLYPNSTATGWRGANCGENLKSTSGWSGGSGTDAYGFTALAGGYCSSFGSFIALESSAYFWTSSNYIFADMWRRFLSNIYYTVNRNYNDQENGYSARCLKD